MKIVVLSLHFVSYGLLYAAATPPSPLASSFAKEQVDEDSLAMSGSGSEACDQNTLATVIHTPKEVAHYLAAVAHVSPESRFNTQFVNKTFVDHEECSMLAIADDTLGQLSQRMYEELDSMPTGAPIWNEMRQILPCLAAPAAHAAIVLANKSSLYMHVNGPASKILLIWPHEIYEMTESVDRSAGAEKVLIDANMLGVLLLRNSAYDNQDLLKVVTASLALKDVCAADIVREIMPSDEKKDRAVGFFDCQRWHASLVTVHPATSAKAPVKKTKKNGNKLLRRIFRNHKTL